MYINGKCIQNFLLFYLAQDLLDIFVTRNCSISNDNFETLTYSIIHLKQIQICYSMHEKYFDLDRAKLVYYTPSEGT